jgi:hypothetical protein
MEMNLIFDLCGEILEWKPDQIIGGYFSRPEIRKIVSNEIINHSDWQELDRGMLGKKS